MCPYFGLGSVHGTIAEQVPFYFFVDGTFKIVFKLCRSKGTVFLLTVTLLTVFCQSLPIIAPKRGNLSSSAISQAVEYLSQFGYLPSSDPSTGNLRTEGQLREAIATMQLFGNVKPTGVLDDATLELMRRRRCGVPDMVPSSQYNRIKRYAIQGQKWPSTNLSWSVKSRDSETDIRMVRSQLRKAFEVWRVASELTFVEVEGNAADIMVSFLKGQHGDGYPFDGEGSVLAHAFFPGEGIGGDAHFDAEERWLPSQPEDEDKGVNLFAVAAHEIGHSLGLSHSSAPGSLMFPYYQVMGECFSLPKDDADGIRHLYGFKEPDNRPTMPPVVPTATYETTTKTSTIPTKKSTKKPRKTTKIPMTPAPEVPDICNTSIDAISVIRRELFVFKGRHFWRLNANRTLRSGYPVAIGRFWHALPSDIERIDAIYERPIDTKIVFFIGKNFWLFSANELEPDYPRPLTDLGLPSDLEHIDAAIVWGHNGKTYFFSGKQFWKFDELEGRVELDYPRNINSWRGVPPSIDAAFQWTDGNTYFFKGSKFWKFVDIKMKIENKGPSEIGGYWFKCPSKSIEITEPATTPRVVVVETDINSVLAASTVPHLYSSVLLVILVFCAIQKNYI